MRMCAEQIETVKQSVENSFATERGVLSLARCAKNQRGFTLIELVAIIIILGIISMVAIPRFAGRNAFDSRAFSDEVKATLKLAQKLAISQRRNVCVNVTTTVPASLTINVTKAANCDTPLPSLAGNGNYQVNTRGGAALTSSAANITFNALGSPGATDITLQVDTEPQIVVSKETGYVH